MKLKAAKIDQFRWTQDQAHKGNS